MAQGVGRSPTSVPREPQEPLSPLPPRPPPLFTDGAETIRLKTEGKSRAVGHNHPGLGGRPLQPWGCRTAHGAHATSPVVLTGRGRWLQERGEEGKARRPGWQLRSEEGLGARVQPRQGPASSQPVCSCHLCPCGPWSVPLRHTLAWVTAAIYLPAREARGWKEAGRTEEAAIAVGRGHRSHHGHHCRPPALWVWESQTSHAGARQQRATKEWPLPSLPVAVDTASLST